MFVADIWKSKNINNNKIILWTKLARITWQSILENAGEEEEKIVERERKIWTRR